MMTDKIMPQAPRHFDGGCIMSNDQWLDTARTRLWRGPCGRNPVATQECQATGNGQIIESSPGERGKAQARDTAVFGVCPPSAFSKEHLLWLTLDLIC